LVIKYLYEKKSNSLTSISAFGRLLPILSLITFLVIMIVKSSLALSLGLVGALSIVRFRTPIKEPEDLVYIFFSIAIGIGYGALQITSTLLVFSFISLVILFVLGNKKSSLIADFNLIISSNNSQDLANAQGNILSFLKDISQNLEIIKFEKNEDNSSNLIIKINFSEKKNYNELISFFNNKYPELNFSVYEHKVLH
jgi:uncharacterized membrane protein YhiD involved in acid resistance